MPEALWVQAPGVSYDAAEDRRLIGAVYTPGVISGFAITPSVGLSVSVSAGVAILSDGLGGCYLAYVDAASTVTLTVSATNSLYVVVNPTTGQATIAATPPGSTPSGARLAIGTATTSSTGVTATSTSGRTFADSPAQPSPKYLAVGGGTVTGVINAQQGVRLGGVSPTARHYAKVHRELAQAIENNAWESLTFQFVDRNVTDYGTLPFTGALPAALSVPVAGDYQLTGSCVFDPASSAGTRQSRIARFNSAGTRLWTKYCSSQLGTSSNRVVFDGMLDAQAGDYFEFEVYQNSGATISTSPTSGIAAGAFPWVAMRLIQAD